MPEPLMTEELLRKLEQLSLSARKPLDPGTVGDHRSRGHGSSLEFADYRNYAPGDDFRRIDWQAYARLGSLFLKLTEGNEQLAVHIVLDNSKSMDWGDPNKLLYAKRLAAALGFVALVRSDTASVTTFDERVGRTLPPIQGRNTVPALLGFLESVSVAGKSRFPEALRQFSSQGHRRGLVILISDLMPGFEWEKGTKHLIASHKEVIILHVLAPQEIEPAASGDVRLVDTETGTPLDVSINPGVLEMYNERLNSWLERIRTFCSKWGIDYIPIDTSMPLDRTVLNYLERRRRR